MDNYTINKRSSTVGWMGWSGRNLHIGHVIQIIIMAKGKEGKSCYVAVVDREGD